MNLSPSPHSLSVCCQINFMYSLFLLLRLILNIYTTNNTRIMVPYEETLPNSVCMYVFPIWKKMREFSFIFCNSSIPSFGSCGFFFFLYFLLRFSLFWSSLVTWIYNFSNSVCTLFVVSWKALRQRERHIIA